MQKKQEVRKQLIAKRDALTDFEREYKSKQIWEKLQKMPEFKQAKKIAFFIGIKSEVQTKKMIQECFNLKKEIFIPLTDFTTKTIKFSRLHSFKHLEEKKFGLIEQTKEFIELIEPNKLELIIIPGIGFDKQCNRLGFGKGFYDRFLTQLKNGQKFIALAFNIQITENIPIEEHDIKVHKIVTESEIINCK